MKVRMLLAATVVGCLSNHSAIADTPTASDIRWGMELVHNKLGLPIKNVPKVETRTIDQLTSMAAKDGYMMGYGAKVVGYYDGSQIYVLNVWDRNNPADVATMLREITRYMSHDSFNCMYTVEMNAAKVQEDYLHTKGLTMASVHLRPTIQDNTTCQKKS